MSMTAAERIGTKLMLAFDDPVMPASVREWLATHHAGGYTFFRGANYRDPVQARTLTDALQRAARESGQLPLLIAVDQEGGQLTTMGAGTTQFAGNMALGATRDTALARRVGQAIGREMAALGVNINYAPICDLNTNPSNPSLGVRAFSDDPHLTAMMAAAMVEGLQAEGVAATLKHFPGKGQAEVDSHYQMPLINHSRERLDTVELPPFQAGIDAGAKLIMTGHFAIPALSGTTEIPATLSRAVMHDFVRDEMGFNGVVITDALDMGAISQGVGQLIDVIAAVRAGVDLMLLTPDDEVQERLYTGLLLAYSRGLITDSDLDASAGRIVALKQWAAAQEQPSLDVVGCQAHLELERELAERSITLMRDEARLLPLALPTDARIAVVMPQPRNLTPADTSDTIAPALAWAVRQFHPEVDEFITSHPPTTDEIADVRRAVADYDLLIVGTINASMDEMQAEMANALLALGLPTVTVALRTPYDLASYSTSQTHLCTYSIQPASMVALAQALFGHITCTGQLPVNVEI